MKKILKKYNILLWGILLLSAILRLYRIDGYMTFLGDEGRDAIVIYNIVHGKLTLLGPTASVGGFFMGPAYYYLVAPFFFLFGNSPIGAAVFVAILSVVTIYLIYKISSEFWDKKVGLIAAFLYAISPVVIVYSRASWNPNVMPFFSLITLYLLYKAVVKKNTWLFVLCGIFYGIDVQLHYTELFVGLAIILFTFFCSYYAQRNVLKTLKDTIVRGLYIFLGFLVGFSPFLAFEIRHSFANTISILDFIFHSKETGGNVNFIPTVSDVVFRLFGRLIFNYPAPDQLHLYATNLLSLWNVAIIITAISSIALLFWNFLKVPKKDTIAFYRYLLFVLWLLCGVLLFGFYKKNIYDYYFEFMFPVPFILVGLLFSKISSFGRLGSVGIIIAVAALGYINLRTTPISYTPNYQFNQAKQIADFVLSKTDGQPFNFALLTVGNSDHAYRYFFKLANRDAVVIENPVIDPKRTSVTKQLMIVCEAPCAPLGASLWEVAGFGRADIVGQWKVSVVEVYKLVHYTGK